MVINVFGNDEETLIRSNAKDVLKRPLTDGAFGFCGINDVVCFSVYGVVASDVTYRQGCTEKIGFLLMSKDQESVVSF